MIIHDAAQGSVEWGQLRAGIPTASEFGNLVTPKFEIRTGEMVETHIAEKVEEWWLGGPRIEVCTFDMDMGKILEEEARPTLALQLGKSIEAVGFITTDDGRVGCSPDGLTGYFEGEWLGEKCMGVEIKCRGTAHVKTLLAGKVPEKDLAQVHGGMFVTGFESWVYYGYRRGFPNLMMTVEWDDRKQATLREAIDAFLFRLEAAKAHLIDLNGGPPKRMLFEPKEPPEEFKSELPT